MHGESEGGINFEMAEGDKEQVGTTITLYLNEDSHEFCNEYRAREVLDKYCAFMPVPIFLDNETAEPQYETIEKDELTDKDTIVETVVEPAKTEEKENEDGTCLLYTSGPLRSISPCRWSGFMTERDWIPSCWLWWSPSASAITG